MHGFEGTFEWISQSRASSTLPPVHKVKPDAVKEYKKAA